MRSRAARLHFGLARIFGAVGWSGLAAAAYGDAIAARPDWPEACLEQGEALARSGNWAAAARAFEQAVRLRPDSAEARGNLVIALAKMGRADDAITALEALTRHRPHDAEAHLVLGTLYQSAHRRDDAMRAFRWAVKLPPPPPHRRCWLGLALLGPTAWADVRGAYDQAVAAAGSAAAGPAPAWHSCLNRHPTETPREFRRIAPRAPNVAHGSRGSLARVLVRAPFRLLRAALRSPRLVYGFFATVPAPIDTRRTPPASVHTFPSRRSSFS